MHSSKAKGFSPILYKTKAHVNVCFCLICFESTFIPDPKWIGVLEYDEITDYLSNNSEEQA